MAIPASVLDHFKKNDVRIFELLQTIPLEVIHPKHPDTFFVSLCQEIIGQQLSGSVADVIYARFLALFGRKKISADRILAVSDIQLRSTGMSWSKVRFICDLARRMKTGEIDLSGLSQLSDYDVIQKLTRVHGIGPWTAEMFLMFTLARPDVFSYGDLGLRHAIQKVYAYRKEPTVRQMEQLTKRWVPYRTYAARALWRYKDDK